MNVIFISIFLLCFPLSFPSFYLAYKLASKRSLKSIFNQNMFLLFVITGKKKHQIFSVCYYSPLSYAGFYTAFSASSLLYISLASEEDSTAEVKLLCSFEITMKLLVVYCWFNSFTYTILFRDDDILNILISYSLLLDTSWSTMDLVWL